MRWISEQVKVRWMVEAIDQRASEGAMDIKINGSGSNLRSDGWWKRWISEQVKVRWILKSMDQGAILGSMNGAMEQ